jgi:adenine nucleotide transporter 17
MALNESLVHAVAGSLGGVSAMAITYPLEQIRTLQQAEDSSKVWILVKDKGLVILYQGCSAVLETVSLSNFLYFYSAQYAKKLLEKRVKNPVILALSSSTLAGVANVALTEPLWKANTILKTMPVDKVKSENLLSVLKTNTQNHGLASLWSGTGVSLWLVANPVIQFSIYEFLKKRRKNLSALQAFVLGAMSKAIATILTYPLQVAQTRLRMERFKHLSMLVVLRALLAEKGISGLFQGCSAKLAQTVLTAAFMFAFYERIFAFLKPIISG